MLNENSASESDDDYIDTERSRTLTPRDASVISRDSPGHSPSKIKKLKKLFSNFCSNSTIHGTYFWVESSSTCCRVSWTIIVFLGLISSGYVIDSSLKSWKMKPYTTTVQQIPIDEIKFMAVTICPIEDTRFNHLAKYMNSKGYTIQTDIERLINEFVEVVENTHYNTNIFNERSQLCLDLFENLGGDWMNPVPDTIKNAYIEKLKSTQKLEETNDKCESSDESITTKASKSKSEYDFVQYISEIFNESDVEIDTILQSVINRTRLKVQQLRYQQNVKMLQMNNCSNYVRKESFRKFCMPIVNSFDIYERLKSFFPSSNRIELMKAARPGNILQMLYSLFESNKLNGKWERIFDTYVQSSPKVVCREKWDEFGGVTSLWEHDVLSLMTMISIWSKHEEDDNRQAEGIGSGSGVCNVTFKGFRRKLVETMRDSAYPAKLVDEQNMLNLNAFIPKCWYNGENLGNNISPYDEKFCEEFEETSNEFGHCYSFNNKAALQQGKGIAALTLPTKDGDNVKHEKMFELVEERYLKPKERTDRYVKGCGKDHGLQLVIDSHKITSLSQSRRGTFKMFINRIGSVYSKIPFFVDTNFKGINHFHVHGIHEIKTTSEFRTWNSHQQFCYMGYEVKLNYFNHYTQDNCIMECRLKKAGTKCGCLPWYIIQDELEICDVRGNTCYHEAMNNDFNILKVHKNSKMCANCLLDCETTHFFITNMKSNFSNEEELNSWFHPDNERSRLYNYLMDPKDVLWDKTSKNLMIFAHNLSTMEELAQKRFDEDISIVNVFFDTPIITQINLEIRTTIFDKISAIGGTLGLFSGISLITFVEVIYWFARICCAMFTNFRQKSSRMAKETLSELQQTSKSAEATTDIHETKNSSHISIKNILDEESYFSDSRFLSGSVSFKNHKTFPKVQIR